MDIATTAGVLIVLILGGSTVSMIVMKYLYVRRYLISNGRPSGQSLAAISVYVDCVNAVKIARETGQRPWFLTPFVAVCGLQFASVVVGLGMILLSWLSS
jgi:hypothetical protein